MWSWRAISSTGDEPGFVNAVLDRVAHRKRAAEFGETPPEDELGSSAVFVLSESLWISSRPSGARAGTHDAVVAVGPG